MSIVFFVLLPHITLSPNTKLLIVDIYRSAVSGDRAWVKGAILSKIAEKPSLGMVHIPVYPVQHVSPAHCVIREVVFGTYAVGEPSANELITETIITSCSPHATSTKCRKEQLDLVNVMTCDKQSRLFFHCCNELQDVPILFLCCFNHSSPRYV